MYICNEINDKNLHHMNFDIKKIKLTENGVRFFHNGRNTTCEYSYYLNIPEQIVEGTGLVMSYPLFDVIKATVKCHNDDKYDEKLGEELALAKAEARAYKLVKNKLLRMIDYMRDLHESFLPLVEEFAEKADRSIEHNMKYMERISGKK